MGFEIIDQIKKEKRLTNAEIARQSGITLSTLDKITAGINKNPKLDTLIAICSVLGCTLNDFVDAPEIQNNVVSYSREAMNIAKQYDDLDDFGKETMEYVLNRETDRVKEIRRLNSQLKNEAAGELMYMQLPFSRQPVSAGRGAYLGPEELDTIFVEKNSLTRRASFAVKVSGDSMEPEYSDGDILLVEGADDIRVGEIGVFTMDGDGYVKERGNEELISLNSEYDPIPMNESIWCNGRVIGKLLPEWVQGV